MYELEQKNAEYKKVARILITYNKNLPIKQEADKKLFGKRAFVQLHQTELEAFEYAEREITRLGLSKTIDTDKVIEKIKQQDEEIRQLHLQVKAAAKLAAEIQSAHEVVKELNGRKTDTAIVADNMTERKNDMGKSCIVRTSRNRGTVSKRSC